MSKKQMVRVVLVEPEETPEIVMVENTLESFRKIVDGYIETYYLGNLGNGPIFAVLNEEGKLIGLPANRNLGHDIIVGTFCIVRVDEGGDFISLTEQEAESIAIDMGFRAVPADMKVEPKMEWRKF